jgi:bifunctional non-homologous end joining protein LigD
MRAIRPMLATLVREPVDRPGWVYEEKYDGDRVIAYRRGGRVRILSRNLKDVTAAFGEIAGAVAALAGGDLVLDGEVVVFDRDGVSRFQLLQRRGMGERLRPVLAVFDCLERDGRSLLACPLSNRRRALEEIVPARADVLMRARRLAMDGIAAHRRAERLGWEGIIAKDPASPYEPGRRTRTWLKVKCRRESEFVIGGFTPPRGGRKHLGALLVGLFDGPALRYAGKVGSGFSEAVLDDLFTRFRSLRTDRCPFHPAPRISGATWVRPEVVAQLAFAEWTRDGKLRQATFLGLRHDKRASDCTWDAREP